MKKLTGLFRYFKNYKAFAILAPLSMLVEVFMDLVQPTLMATIVDKGISAGNSQVIIYNSILMFIVAIIGMSGGLGGSFFSAKAGIGATTDLRDDLYSTIQTYSYDNIDRLETGNIVTRLTNDVTQIQNVFIMALKMFVRAPLMFVGSLILAIRTSPDLVPILIISTIILLIALALIVTRAFPMFATVQKKVDGVNRVLQENISGIRVVKAFVRERFEKSRFNTSNEELMDIMVKATKTVSLVMPIMMLTLNLGITAAVYQGGVYVINGQMDVGSLMAFTNYMMLLLGSFMMLAMMIVMASRAQASATRLEEVLEQKSSLANKSNPITKFDFKGEIEFENVSFTYGDSDNTEKSESTLRNVSFKVKPGETLGVIGTTGSGKSTLINLIPRLYDTSEGNVLVDGVNVKDFDFNYLRKNIGLCMQETLLFTGTIEENIAFGCEEFDEERVIKAAKIAQAHEFILEKENGYKGQVEQKGSNFSGGQKQRISIARAIAKEPKILIFDDSTSAVDANTEKKIRDLLFENLKDTTTIIISQKISSVVNADRTIVIDDGKIMAIGSHEELLEKSDIYLEIFNIQNAKEA